MLSTGGIRAGLRELLESLGPLTLRGSSLGWQNYDSIAEDFIDPTGQMGVLSLEGITAVIANSGGRRVICGCYAVGSNSHCSLARTIPRCSYLP